MKTTITLIATALLLAACGSKQTPADPKEEVVATTDDVKPEADENEEMVPEDEGALPAPSDVAAVPPNAESSPSGLAWTILSEGDGAGSPTIDSTIKVHYTGWTTDGKMFDSSVVRNEPIEFPLAKLIKGWQEGIPMMSRGEKRRFWIPSELAYGESTREGVPQGLLVFDIELIDFH